MTQPIQLYSMATPNGQKIGIALEEMGLPYEAHTVNIMTGEQFSSDFIRISPNSKIPAIVDPEGPDGQPISIFESGAILLYLAQKSHKFWPAAPREQMEVMQWLFFQVGGVGPIFGQFGHFYKHAAGKCADPYPIERYTQESRRFLKVLENRLRVREYLAGNAYTIADMATVPWVHGLSAFYEADQKLGLQDFPAVRAWAQRLVSRPQTAKGMSVCKIQSS